MKNLHKFFYIILWLGGLNWGLMGLFKYNFVEAFLGSFPSVTRAVYILVGVATIYLVATHKDYCKICGGEMKEK